MTKLTAILMLACFSIAGCITTTTGPTESKTDDADGADLNYQLGARYYRNGSYELARQRLEHSIKLNPKVAHVHSTLALTYEALGNMRLATESYERAVKLAPKDFDVQNSYAVFMCRKGDFDEAKKFFDRSIAVYENDNAEIMMTNAGICMTQKPDPVAAEKYFRQALERKPNFGEALLQMCLLKNAAGENLAARAFMQRYLAANKPSAGVLYLAIQIEGALGDRRARSEYSDQLIREFPTSPEARMILESS